MNNSDMPAMPQSVAHSAYDGELTASYDFEGGQGLTKREYFAAMAPSEIPQWFKDEFEPIGLPSYPDMTKEEKRHLREYRNENYGYSDYDKGKELDLRLSIYNQNDTNMIQQQEYFAWRAYYADMVLKELEK